MADLNRALVYALRWEGGWSDDPDDSGGATNYGITLARAQKHGIKTKEELRNISSEKVYEIYMQDYFKVLIPVKSQAVATKIFSHCINMGDSPWIGNPAVRLLQKSLVQLDQDVMTDGIWGPKTLCAVNNCDPEKLLEVFAYQCVLRYQAIALNNPKNQKFLHGWLRRANDLPEITIQDTTGAA